MIIGNKRKYNISVDNHAHNLRNESVPKSRQIRGSFRPFVSIYCVAYVVFTNTM